MHDSSPQIWNAVVQKTLEYWHVAWTAYLRPYWWIWVPVLLLLIGLRLLPARSR